MSYNLKENNDDNDFIEKVFCFIIASLFLAIVSIIISFTNPINVIIQLIQEDIIYKILYFILYYICYKIVYLLRKIYL